MELQRGYSVSRYIIGYKKKTSRFIQTRKLTEIIVPSVVDARILLGVPSSTANKREGIEDEKEPINNAELLSIHEHGTIDGRIPARPLIEPVIIQEKVYINNGFDKYLKLIIANKFNQAEIQLEKMAIYLEGKLVEYFDNNNWTPNAPSTIKKKGSAKPLIDTGDLRRSIRAFVEGGKL